MVEFSFIASRRADVARVLGISERRFADYLAAGCPGERGNYDLREIIPWVKENVWCKRNPKPILSDPDADIENDSESSPALERLREERWKRERIKRQLEEQEIIARDKVHDIFGIIGGVIRGMGEQLQKQFGPDAVDILDECLDDIDRQSTEIFGDDDNQSSTQ